MKAAIVALLLASTILSSAPARAQRYKQVDLVSDLSGQALHMDSHLVNPWGIVPGPTGVFWVSNNGTSTSTLYDPDGTIRSLVVNIPGGAPTGVALASASDSSFRIPSADSTARAVFIFVTEDGAVAAWSPLVNQTNAIQVATVSGAHYTGVTIGGPAGTPHLYAANFHTGTIDVFDRDFHQVTLAGHFTDPDLPANYTPFNVANLGGQLYVAYAQTADFVDETQAPGLGLVDVFDLNGTFVKRLVSPGGELNAPWGMVIAPSGFGAFGGSLLVGNLGGGHIDAYNPSSGSFQGALQDSTGATFAIPGLWGLSFGAAASGATVAGRLYFAAGIQDETHGLFGFLTPATNGGGGGGGEVCANQSKGIGFWQQVCRSPSEGDDHDHPPGKAIGWGKNHGPNGKHHDDDHGNGHGHGHGHGFFGDHGISADSLDALLGCVTEEGGAFGSGGCFTADCGFLGQVGTRSDRDKAAQQLLALRLNLCSGLVCDGTHACGQSNGDTLTVGEVADSLDFLLCHGGSSSDIGRMAALAACINGGGGEGEDSDDAFLHRGKVAFIPTIEVRTSGAAPARLGGDPIRLSISATMPSVVGVRIYDAMGRLVAEPMRNALVSGTAEVQWNGRGLHGELVPPGSYFYRATTGHESTSGRILIIR